MAENTKRYYWLKLKDDFFDEKYVKALRKLPQGDSLAIVYFKMQLKSLKTEGIIKYEGIMPDAISELALLLDEDENVVRFAIEALIRFGVVERWDNETFYLVALQQLIGSETQGAARVRKHRELKQAKAIEGEKPKALQCNEVVTTCNTEKEEEEEKDTEEREEKERKSIDYQAIIDCYNDTCVSFPKVKALSDSRKKAIKARLNTYSIEDIKTVFEKAEASDFLKGKNDRNWQANFDWLMKDSNFAKVIDGNYDSTQNGWKGNGNATPQGGGQKESMLDRAKRMYAMYEQEANGGQ